MCQPMYLPVSWMPALLRTPSLHVPPRLATPCCRCSCSRRLCPAAAPHSCACQPKLASTCPSPPTTTSSRCAILKRRPHRSSPCTRGATPCPRRWALKPPQCLLTHSVTWHKQSHAPQHFHPNSACRCRSALEMLCLLCATQHLAHASLHPVSPRSSW